MPYRPGRHGSVVACCVIGLLAGSATSGVGCSHDTDLSGTLADAGRLDADAAASGPRVTVTTRAPKLTVAPGEKASATWAAYQLDGGVWVATAAIAMGTYALPVPRSEWAIALVCANDEGSFTKVFVHHRTAATLALDAELEQECTPDAPAPEFAFTGTLSGLPGSTQWLDFGYPRDSRGSALAAAGGTAPYEIVGIAPGTWDLAFGVRDDSFGSLKRMVLRRGEVVTADRRLDVDFASAAAFTPGQSTLVLHGIDPGDTITPTLFYAAAGGPSGIDVGPEDVPPGADVTLKYATVPEPARVPSDRYHGVITAERDRRSVHRRVELSIGQASNLDVTLPPLIEAPRVTVVAMTSRALRLETRFAAVKGAVRHEVLVVGSENRRTQHAWQTSFDEAAVAGAPDIVDAMPDLSALPGWNAAWEVPVGVDVSVTATVVEAESVIGDGTMQRTSAREATVVPP